VHFDEVSALFLNQRLCRLGMDEKAVQGRLISKETSHVSPASASKILTRGGGRGGLLPSPPSCRGFKCLSVNVARAKREAISA